MTLKQKIEKCSRCNKRPSEGLSSSRDMCMKCYLKYSDEIAEISELHNWGALDGYGDAR